MKFGLICLAAFWASEAGGVVAVLNSAPEGHFRFFPEPEVQAWTDWGTAWMIIGFGSIASQDVFQRVNAARSETAAQQSAFYGAGFYLLFSMLPLFIMLAVVLLYPELQGGDPQAVLPRAVLAHAPMWIQVLFFGSVLSAIMSTCSGALLAPASVLAENLIKPYWGEKVSDRQLLWLTRMSILLVALVAFFMALSHSNIYDLVAESSILGLVSIFVPMTAALYLKRPKPLAAMLAMIFGCLVWGVCDKWLLLPIDALVPGLLASLSGFGLGQWLGAEATSAEGPGSQRSESSSP